MKAEAEKLGGLVLYEESVFLESEKHSRYSSVRKGDVSWKNPRRVYSIQIIATVRDIGTGQHNYSVYSYGGTVGSTLNNRRDTYDTFHKAKTSASKRISDKRKKGYVSIPSSHAGLLAEIKDAIRIREERDEAFIIHAATTHVQTYLIKQGIVVFEPILSPKLLFGVGCLKEKAWFRKGVEYVGCFPDVSDCWRMLVFDADGIPREQGTEDFSIVEMYGGGINDEKGIQGDDLMTSQEWEDIFKKWYKWRMP